MVTFSKIHCSWPKSLPSNKGIHLITQSRFRAAAEFNQPSILMRQQWMLLSKSQMLRPSLIWHQKLSKNQKESPEWRRRQIRYCRRRKKYLSNVICCSEVIWLLNARFFGFMFFLVQILQACEVRLSQWPKLLVHQADAIASSLAVIVVPGIISMLTRTARYGITRE